MIGPSAARILEAAHDGPSAVLDAFVREMIGLARLSVRGVRAQEIDPTVLVERVTLPTTASQVAFFGEDTFRNGRNLDFVAQALIPCTFGTSSQRLPATDARFAVRDRDSREYLIGSANSRIYGGHFIDDYNLPTQMCFFAGEGHILRPQGGLLGEMEAVSSSVTLVVEIALVGYWVRRW